LINENNDNVKNDDYMTFNSNHDIEDNIRKLSQDFKEINGDNQ